MTKYQWKDVSVVGFDELMQALDRADCKGYMPDAIKEDWEAFNWEPAQRQARSADTWVELTDREIDELWMSHHDDFGNPLSATGYERAIEAKLKEKNSD